MKKLRLLIRYTDLLVFTDIEDSNDCRMTMKIRGRNDKPVEIQGDVEGAIARGLAVVEAYLPSDLKEKFSAEKQLL